MERILPSYRTSIYKNDITIQWKARDFTKMQSGSMNYPDINGFVCACEEPADYCAEISSAKKFLKVTNSWDKDTYIFQKFHVFQSKRKFFTELKEQLFCFRSILVCLFWYKGKRLRFYLKLSFYYYWRYGKYFFMNLLVNNIFK